MGIFVASSPSSPRQVLSRCVRPAAVSMSRVSNSSLTDQSADVVAPPIGLRKRCVAHPQERAERRVPKSEASGLA